MNELTYTNEMQGAVEVALGTGCKQELLTLITKNICLNCITSIYCSTEETSLGCLPETCWPHLDVFERIHCELQVSHCTLLFPSWKWLIATTGCLDDINVNQSNTSPQYSTVISASGDSCSWLILYLIVAGGSRKCCNATLAFIIANCLLLMWMTEIFDAAFKLFLLSRSTPH